MGAYLEEIKKPENLPSWLGLIGILLSGLAILFLVIDRESKSTSVEIQSIIISQMELTGSTTIEDVLPVANDKGYKEEQVKSEFYALVAKRILLKTSVGFEVKRFTTRLFDEIQLVINYEYSNCSTNNICINNQKEFDTAVLNVMCKLKGIEKERTRDKYSDDAFIPYLSGIDWYIREKFYELGKVNKDFGFTVKKSNESVVLTKEVCEAG